MEKREPIRLTKSAVAALRPGSDAYFVPVVNSKGQAIQGLNLRVLPSGLRVFVHRYRFLGFQKVYTLGQWPAMTCDAAEKASKAAQVSINAGMDPGQLKNNAKLAALEARRAAFTVADLAERFIAEHVGAEVTWKGRSFKVEIILRPDGKPMGNKESTAREHIRLIHRNILPALGELPLAEIGTAEVSALLFKIRKDHPTQSNRVRSVISKMFTCAELWGLRPSGSNPARGQVHAQEKKKDRNLSDRELVAVGEALRAAQEIAERPRTWRRNGDPKREDLFALAALRLALLTGMRKSEIIGDRYRGIPALTWQDVDKEAGVLRIHHKSDTRTGKRRTVYLCRAVRGTLDALPRVLGNPHVIPGEVVGRSLVNLQAVWDRIRDAVAETSRQESKKAGKKTPGIDVSDVTLHDLRRTFASVATRLGYPELWIGALLGHSATTVTQGYAIAGGDPLRDAVEAIGGRIAGLLDGSIDLAEEAEHRGQGKEAKPVAKANRA